MRSSKRKYVALLVTFFLLASLSAHAFNAISLMHELDHERHQFRESTSHSHLLNADDPSEVPPMNGMQHLALHSIGDIQPLVLGAFIHPLVTPLANITPPSYSSVAVGLPDRDPPFRPPQSA